MGWLVQATNCRAVADGTGSGTYVDFVPFDLPELYKFVGLLFANGLTPKPQFEYWFKGQGQELLFGNNKYAGAMDKHVHKGQGQQEALVETLPAILHLVDFRDNLKESRQANPL